MADVEWSAMCYNADGTWRPVGFQSDNRDHALKDVAMWRRDTYYRIGLGRRVLNQWEVTEGDLAPTWQTRTVGDLTDNDDITADDLHRWRISLGDRVEECAHALLVARRDPPWPTIRWAPNGLPLLVRETDGPCNCPVGVAVVTEPPPPLEALAPADDTERTGTYPGHECCPDCGDDPNDHTSHADGCRRIGQAVELQCGPPWNPWPDDGNLPLNPWKGEL